MSSQADEESYDEESEGDASSAEDLLDSTTEESESDTSSVEDVLEFVAEECLFCNYTSKDFDENLSHMHQAHGFIVPSQSSLAVDLENVIWFLYMVIYNYGECICCGTRRRTVQAVQQHMVSKGHCRFDVTEEMSSLYDMDSLGPQPVENLPHPDDNTLRLPSGKVLGDRSNVNLIPRRLLRGESTTGRYGLPASSQSDTDPQALTKRGRKEQALTTRERKDHLIETWFSKLRTSDKASLMHLTGPQKRTQMKLIRKAMFIEKRMQGRAAYK
ncbi:C2H2-type zinc finger protein [Candidatus Bathyarchaeota archaeon]|nr:C2H2-type zinc finger protein [Candidatus Bathyarchaeota archaeon]